MLYTSYLDERNIEGYFVEYNHSISILCDNTSAINISNNLVMHLKRNHISIKYYFLREKFTK
jgi:hypothetical protein